MNIHDFCTNIANGKVARTLDDHMTILGITEYNSRKSMRNRLAKYLSKGGSYRGLVEQGLVLPTTYKMGRTPAWAAGIKPVPNAIALIETDSKHTAVISEVIKSTPFAKSETVPVLQTTKDMVSRLSPKKQKVMADAFTAITEEHTIQWLEAQNAITEKNAAYRENQLLLALLKAKGVDLGDGVAGSAAQNLDQPLKAIASK